MAQTEDGMAIPQTPQKTTASGWIFLALFFVLLGTGVLGVLSHNGLLMAAGFLPILLLLAVITIRNNRRARRDPEYAEHLAQVRVRAREKAKAERSFRLRELPFTIAPLLLFLVLLATRRSFLPPDAVHYLDNLPHHFGNGILMAVSLAVVFGGRIAWSLAKRKSAVPST
jgi:hypothetical protein